MLKALATTNRLTTLTPPSFRTVLTALMAHAARHTVTMATTRPSVIRARRKDTAVQTDPIVKVDTSSQTEEEWEVVRHQLKDSREAVVKEATTTKSKQVEGNNAVPRGREGERQQLRDNRAAVVKEAATIKSRQVEGNNAAPKASTSHMREQEPSLKMELYTTPLDLSYPQLMEGEKVEGLHVKQEVRFFIQSSPHHHSFMAGI